MQENIISQGFDEKRKMRSANLGCKSQGWVTLNGSQDGSILRVNTEISCNFVKTSTLHGVTDWSVNPGIFPQKMVFRVGEL